MAVVTVDLQEGFANDEVVVEINGQRVYHRQGVSTRYQIGLADRVEHESEGTAVVKVALPQRGLWAQTELERSTHVGASVTGEGQLVLQSRAEPFYYL